MVIGHVIDINGKAANETVIQSEFVFSEPSLISASGELGGIHVLWCGVLLRLEKLK